MGNYDYVHKLVAFEALYRRYCIKKGAPKRKYYIKTPDMPRVPFNSYCSGTTSPLFWHPSRNGACFGSGVYMGSRIR
ncbi:hypothetical protein NX059_003148 [Plenodomus lindquistii]|nr:hypothetical protein NX059_003148 [Plenodomus lindquistii]